jgi:hypothetical protein
MISYVSYKTLHIFFILLFFSSMGFVVYQAPSMQKKMGQFLIGLVSFLIFVAGMGLIARLGYKHSEPFPLWIKLKMGNWFLINLLFVAMFKVKTREYKSLLFGVILLLAWFSIWVAVNKPL